MTSSIYAYCIGRNKKYLASVVNASQSHYRRFLIKKRRGGKREISAPYLALLECQQWILEHILNKVKIHGAAHGYVVGKSIITNATAHIGQDYLLKVDIKDFFPSIRLNQVFAVFKELGYTSKVSYYLAAICCLNGTLPQGAPTSPALSNIIAIRIDRRMSLFATKCGLNYTRYADDLAFSGKKVTPKHLEYIIRIVESCGFSVNESKTKLLSNKRKRILTGISVASNSLKIPRNYKRELKKEIHYIRKYGHISHMRKCKIKSTDYLHRVIGKLRFWLSVEPNSKIAQDALNDLTKKYQEIQKQFS